MSAKRISTKSTQAADRKQSVRANASKPRVSLPKPNVGRTIKKGL